MTQPHDETSARLRSTLGVNVLRTIFAFESITPVLERMPFAAKRALEVAGRSLAEEGWPRLTLADRKILVIAGAAEIVDRELVDDVLRRAGALTLPVARREEPHASPPAQLIDALGPGRPLDETIWQAFSALERYALESLVGDAAALSAAYDEIIPQPQLSHLNEHGEARMVDISRKERSIRRATASAVVSLDPSVLRAIQTGGVPKGDVLAVARIAGIQAAKRTSELIPLCHPIALTALEVVFGVDEMQSAIHIRATAEAFDRTGVEMEALVAASTAALTIYDMVKSMDRWATIRDIHLDEKLGGKSGHLTQPPPADTRASRS